MQYGGAEVEAHIQHGCLVGQRCAAVLWQWVCRHLVVYIIRAQPPNDHANKRGADGNPLEIALWVIRRSFGSRLIRVACAAQEFADVI